MNIREFIKECEKIAAKYGDDCEVRGWGDQGAAIGIEALKVVGTVDASEKGDKSWREWHDEYAKYCKMFGAVTARERDGKIEFLAEIKGDDASIGL